MDPELLKLLATIFGGQQNQQQPPMDMNALIGALSGPNNPPSALAAQHDNWVGAQGPSYMGNQNNPFNNGFFKSEEERAQTSPFLAMSEGQRKGALGTNRPVPDQNALGAIAASPAPFMPQQNNLSFLPPAPLTSPMGSPEDDAAALQQNLAMMAPGGMSGFWGTMGAPVAGTPMSTIQQFANQPKKKTLASARGSRSFR